MRTALTRSFCPLEDADVPDVALVLLLEPLSSVPVISTSWLMCDCRSLVIPSRWYVLPVPDVPVALVPDVLVPDVLDEGDVLLVPVCALVSTKRSLALEVPLVPVAVPVVLPDVPVEPA